jgi:hypothetical protein
VVAHDPLGMGEENPGFERNDVLLNMPDNTSNAMRNRVSSSFNEAARNMNNNSSSVAP